MQAKGARTPLYQITGDSDRLPLLRPGSMPEVTPQLSVVVAATESADLEECLSSLEEQSKDKDVEIIVAIACGDESVHVVVARYPQVIFIQCPWNSTLPHLLGAGIARSTGDIIAISDSSCAIDGHWISAILKAHETPYPVIGGAVEVARCRNNVDWAAYFCEYGQFMHPLAEGVVNELPGNNVSFKRDTLDKGREFVRKGFWKTYWCRKLQEEGIPLISMPSMVVYYRKSYRLSPFLIRRFHHGRCFAGMRVARTSIPRRACYVAGAPILPFLLLARITRSVASKGRYRKEFLFSLPFSLLAIAGWSLGEFWGYLAGPGNSCRYIT
jgi:glycosyltransferase involved in cell wall biosynthesis